MIIDKEKHYLTFKRLNMQNIINSFTFKPYNFRDQFVSRDEINKNYEKLQNGLGCKFLKIIKPKQTHTTNIEVVTKENINDEFKDVDGLVTDLKEIALVVSLADCQGIFLYDKKKEIIGNIHSGWRGTLNRITENAINLMRRSYNCNTEDIEAYICPSILKCCFEVDFDVAEEFKNNFKDIDIQDLIEYNSEKNKYYIDTVEINKKMMINMGLKEENIETSNLCTKCNSDFLHSYRADGNNSGRNIGIIANFNK